MSNTALTWAWKQGLDLPSNKLVLLALADHADGDGCCWPSIERIKDMTSLSQPTIYRAMQILIDLGLLHKARTGRSNKYHLALDLMIEGTGPYTKQPISRSLRTAVMERDLYRCQHCGTHKQLEVDHIHPESKGGKSTLENLQVLCRPCNRAKGVKTAETDDDTISYTSHGETYLNDQTSHHDKNNNHGEKNTNHHETLTTMNHQEPPKKECEAKRKLSTDWQPDDQLLLWAEERAPHVDTTLETEKFIDHFCHIKPDRRTDSGWRASWRNWILRSRRDYTPPAARFPTRSERTSQRNAALVRDALADRPQAHDSLRDPPGLPFRIIDGGKARAD